MYSRAPRTIGQTVGSTPLHLGPGTYDVTAAEAKRQHLDSYAPFLSLSLRDGIFTGLDETPGPGQYELRTHASYAKGGSSLANKESRFAIKKDEVPGPGAYVIPNKENKLNIGSLKVSKQRVKFNRKKNAPSIQDPKTAYGFEESPNGELIPQAPPERDPSIGPAYYNTSSAEAHSSQYKGNHFSKYSSKRSSSFGAKAGPGPGEYDTVEPVQVDIEHYHMKNLTDKKPELNVPRYPEMMLKNIEKESVPGPGKYNQKRLFDDVVPRDADYFGIEPDRPPFGVQTRRFDAPKNPQPGPGAYNDQRTAFNALGKISGLKKTPFLQSSARFETENLYKSRSAPGPGQYRINGFAEEILRKSIIDANRKPAFGQSSMRKFNQSKKDEYNMPGPAQYQIRERSYKSKKENYTANFASGTKRNEIPIEDTPGPTAYDVPKAYDNLIHTRREAPRTKLALKRQESFNVVSKREFNIATDPDNPGPGSYDNLNLQKTRTYVAKLTDKRWKDNNDKQPGPGFYELSPMYQDTLLKGTFNATLRNPFVIKERQKLNSDTNITNKFGLHSLEAINELKTC